MELRTFAELITPDDRSLRFTPFGLSTSGLLDPEPAAEFERKLDAAKLARKTSNSQGVRNLITVAGPNVPDALLEQKLAVKHSCAAVDYTTG